MSRSAAVIGSGFGGLALAIRLQSAGIDTTIVEARDKPGGRAFYWKKDGHVFDAGPTVITDPACLRDLWALSGADVDEDVSLVPVTPFYRLSWPDGSIFDYSRAARGRDAARAQARRRWTCPAAPCWHRSRLVVEVEGGIVGKTAAAIDIAEQPVVARPEQDAVMRNVRPIAVRRKMNHEQGGREPLAAELCGFPSPAIMTQHVVGPDDVRIGGNSIEAAGPAATSADSGDPPPLGVDRFHRIVQPDRASKPLEMAHHAGHQSIGAAKREPDAAIPLQLADQRVNGACGGRIAAHQKCVKGDFEADLGSHLGSAFSLEPILTQSA